MIITESYKTWKLPISGLEKIEACSLWQQASTSGKQFYHYMPCFKNWGGGGVFILFICKVYICSKEKLKLNGN